MWVREHRRCLATICVAFGIGIAVSASALVVRGVEVRGFNEMGGGRPSVFIVDCWFPYSAGGNHSVLHVISGPGTSFLEIERSVTRCLQRGRVRGLGVLAGVGLAVFGLVAHRRRGEHAEDADDAEEPRAGVIERARARVMKEVACIGLACVVIGSALGFGLGLSAVRDTWITGGYFGGVSRVGYTVICSFPFRDADRRILYHAGPIAGDDTREIVQARKDCRDKGRRRLTGSVAGFGLVAFGWTLIRREPTRGHPDREPAYISGS